jgi:hypothetical protein
VVNEWENFMTGEFDSDDSSLLLGPSLKLASGRFFGGATYLVSTSDYDYSGRVLNADGSRTEEAASADRADLDVVVGFMLHPRFSLFGGYKRLVTPDASFQRRREIPSENRVLDGEELLEMEITGFAFGATCNYPLPKMPIVLSANAAYMPNMSFEMDALFKADEITDGEVTDQLREQTFEDYHADGYVFELAATYTFREKIGLSLGYKYQEIEEGDNLGEKGGGKNMTFSGVTFGIDYRF